MKTLSATLVLLCASALAQGPADYLNVETPHVKPLEVAAVDGRQYLLVCNSADNSVEVWDTDENSSQRFRLRVPVGLEPNSITYDPSRKVFYTTDFLGDSITSVVLFHLSGALQFSVIRTRNLGTSDASAPGLTQPAFGDEPMDITLLPAGNVLAVSSNSASTVTFLDSWTLEPVAVGAVASTIVPMNPSGNNALKEPRRLIARGNEVFVLAFKGGSVAAGNMPGARNHDLDLVAVDTTTGNRRSWGGFGTTNAGMAMASDGDLYVVGGFARNDLPGGAAVRTATTGFVKSMVWVSRGGALPATGAVQGRDLNDLTPNGTPTAVPIDKALANPRDVIVYEPTAGNRKIFVSAMGSDRIAVLTDNGGHPNTWPLARIHLTPANAPYTTQRGPRGMVFKPAITGSPSPRLYVLNRITNSVTTIDPTNDQIVGEFALNQDVTPARITSGRPFLYNARLSFNGFSSCASCHMDGRTDSLAWDLGSKSGYREPFLVEFSDSATGATVQLIRDLIFNGFEPDKHLMVTQTLQGLVNYEVEGDAQDLVSNQPYHWRGDRLDFLSFNEGFVGLLGRTDQNANNGSGTFQPPADRPKLPMGIPGGEMAVFRDFVESIHYPPNPRQQLNRQLSGDFGTDPDDIFDGNGALAGLKAFHTVPTLNGRSCVHCHALPEGSNNRYTFTEGGTPPRPLESAAMRGLVQRERTLTSNDGQLSSIIVSNFGLLSAGTDDGINSFEDRFAAFYEPLEQQAGQSFDRTFIKQFVHEMDWGIAPMVGQSATVADQATALQLQRISDFEAECKAGHVGLAVMVQLGSFNRSAYRFDPIAGVYRNESGGSDVDRTALLNLVSGLRNRAFFRTTPLGSDRRVASLSGVASALPFSSITSARLLSMVPNPSNATIPAITKNWVRGNGTDPFEFNFNHPESLPTPVSAKLLRQLQYAQIQDAGGAYGLGNLRHDAPRRIRVAAMGLQPGAKLLLGIWPNTAPNTNPPASAATRTLELPLYPTSATDNGTPVWETAVELDVREYLLLMAGGPSAPGVAAALVHTLPEPPVANTFDPLNWNRQHVTLQNPGQAPTVVGWMALSIQ